jgi:predicted nucleotide-binding protein
VIFELGWFYGKLGRGRVCALYSGGVNLPSDLDGVLWVPLDAQGGWKFALGKEMRAAGYTIDLNRLA